MNQLSVGNIVHVGDMEFHSIEGGCRLLNTAFA